jgi:drug/metabolite transporter (DMT)-like permease
LRACAELAYLGLVPTVLAYVFWDIAVRCGDLNLVAVLSYFTPLLSTLASCLYLGVVPGVNLLLGCVLVISGALMSRASIIDGTSK